MPELCARSISCSLIDDEAAYEPSLAGMSEPVKTTLDLRTKKSNTDQRPNRRLRFSRKGRVPGTVGFRRPDGCGAAKILIVF